MAEDQLQKEKYFYAYYSPIGTAKFTKRSNPCIAQRRHVL